MICRTTPRRGKTATRGHRIRTGPGQRFRVVGRFPGRWHPLHSATRRRIARCHRAGGTRGEGLREDRGGLTRPGVP